MTSKADLTAMKADLAKSGLDKQVKKLGVKVLTLEETKARTGRKLPAYEIPYFGLNGKPIGFSRLKYLSDKIGFGGKLKSKYFQEKGSDSHAYFPPFVKWDKIAKDVEQSIFITEGEKKSACATINGFPTIGLGGVWSWKSKKKQVPFIEDLEAIEWDGREAIIVFDSDVVTNPKVMGAMHALSKKLSELGANPMYILLPGDEEHKIGFDDYLMEYSAEEFEELPIETFEHHEELTALNNELAIIEDPTEYYMLSTGTFINYQKLINAAMSDRIINVVNANGETKEINAVTLWTRWPLRRKHKKLTYSPGQQSVLDDTSLNIWTGWGSEPIKGDVSLWDKLLDNTFKDHDTEKKWFEQWCAYPIQYPVMKMYSAAMLFSIKQGVGKTLLGYTLGKIYGENFAEIKDDDLHGAFNAWAQNKQFILADEVSSSNRKRDADRLKQLVTRERIQINNKFQPQYFLDDLINYLFVSNHPDAVYIEKFDRRFFIHEISGNAMPRSFFTKYDKWYKSVEGINALHYYMLHNVDTSGFDPLGPALETKSRSSMRGMASSDLEHWVHELFENPIATLSRSSSKSLFTAKELLSIYNPDGMRNATVPSMDKSLKSEGFHGPIKVNNDGEYMEIWVAQNRDKWEHASDKALLKEYLKHKK